MESTICNNELCRGATSSQWKRGWSLKSGGFAKLCYNCGSAYENVAFCEVFHLGESGWRKCRICGKHIHCGCIASKYLYEFMDYGGIGCISCLSRLGNHASRSLQTPYNGIPNANGTFAVKNVGKLPQLSNAMETCEPIQLFRLENDEKTKREECLLNFNMPKQGADTYGSFDRPSNFSSNTPVDYSSSLAPGVYYRGREQNEVFTLHQGQISNFPKQPEASQNHDSKSKGGRKTPTDTPTKGRGYRSQLLPRYRPKITDRELQQLSGDLKSTVVPLFDKVLTASDAGRVGRLVLPKACAEAYFPRISHSDGLPIRIQDMKGREWTFLFRYWLNNTSRMYVLEGVTACIQSMRLQAGDTVTFSRIDPGGKLVMSFRKVTNKDDTQFYKQDPRRSTLPADNSQRNISNTQNIELRITMEEAQELFRPPPYVKPSILTIDDIEFEAYNEPPLFGKGTISGALSSRCSCCITDEINYKELDTSVKVGKGSIRRKRKITEKTALALGKDEAPGKYGFELDSASKPGFIRSENDCNSKGRLDLNCHPAAGENDLQVEVTQTTTHFHIANVSSTNREQVLGKTPMLISSHNR